MAQGLGNDPAPGPLLLLRHPIGGRKEVGWNGAGNPGNLRSHTQ
jgi:hypothetical protein